jgi:hypothetical protein
MKRYLSLLAFFFVTFSYIAAQGNGGGGHQGSGGSGSGSGSGHNGSQSSTSPWAGMNIPNSWKHWLNNGGNMPGDMRDAILVKAATWGMQNFGFTVNQMKQRYNQGTLTIQYLTTAPPTLSFRVSYGGGNISVIIDP